jgi:hypothetical protein
MAPPTATGYIETLAFGIGTTTPGGALEVDGTQPADSSGNGTPASPGLIVLAGTGGNTTGTTGQVGGTGGTGGGAAAGSTNGNGGAITLQGGMPGTGGTGGAYGSILLAPNGGYVGVGTNSPSSLLAVGSSSQFTVDGLGNVAAAGLKLAGFTAGAVVFVGSGGSLAQSNVGTSGQALVSGGTSQPSWFAPSPGAIVYAGASGALAGSAVGTIGQALVSGGTSTPTWFAPSAGAVLVAGSGGALAATAVGTTGRALVSGGASTPTWFNPSAGAVIYVGSSGALAGTATGTAGQALVSGAGASPTWFQPTLGSIIFAGSNGALAQNNSQLFWNNTSLRLGIGLANPAVTLHQLVGGVYFQGLATPQPTVTAHGSGSTSYTYFVVARDALGHRSLVSEGVTVTNGALGGSTYNVVSWSAIPGATSYDILFGTPTALLLNTTSTSYTDLGPDTTTAYTPPGRNESDDVAMDGLLTLNSDVIGQGVSRDAFAWDAKDARAAYLAVGANNGAQSGTMPRNRAILPEAPTDIETFDAGTYVNANAVYFQGVVFDGKRIYWIPFGVDTAPPLGGFLAYNITKSFTDPTSYEFANLPTLLNDPQAEGFLGACLDNNGYLYLVPNIYYNGTANQYNARAYRFDTRKSLADTTAYTYFDVGANFTLSHYGWATAVFDGQYVYFCPSSQLNANGSRVAHGVALRYDTTQSFTTSNSWAHYNVASIPGGTNLVGFQTSLFDGRYVYFAPYGLPPNSFSGQIVRYDTTAGATGFTSASSWAFADLTLFNQGAVGFTGACLIGRHIYLVPWQKGSATATIVARFDTQDPRAWGANFTTYAGSGNPPNLTSQPAWQFADLSQISNPYLPNAAAGYQGAWSDGIYLYLVPTSNGGQLGHTLPPLARYDTRQAFRDYTNGWSLYLLPNSPPSTGAAWDGQFAYLGPYGGFTGSGVITRIRTFTPGPTDILGAPLEGADTFRDSNGNIGLGVSPALYGLHQLGGSQRLQALANPSAAPALIAYGGTGTTYGYYIVARDKAGNRTLAGPQQTVSGPPSLMAPSQYINLTWSAIAGAASYDVVRHLNGSTPSAVGLIATVVGTTSFNDLKSGTGSVIAAYSPPASNQTANTYVDGSVETAGLQIGVVSPAGDYAMQPTDSVVLATGATFGVTVTLPSAAAKGKVVVVVKADTGIGAVTVQPISGESLVPTNPTTLQNRGNSVALVADGGSAWYYASNH